MKQARNPSSVHAPLAGYSHQIELTGERLLMLSGQVGMTPDGAIPEDAAAQFELALLNVLRNLEAAAHLKVTDLVKLTFYLAEPVDPARRAALLARHLGGHAPCMTLLYVAGLASPALKVEIDGLAAA